MTEQVDWVERLAKDPFAQMGLLVYFTRVSERVFTEEMSEIGSLFRPEESVRNFIEQDLHRDPPEVREYAISHFWRWIRLRSEFERTEGGAGVARRFLEFFKEAP